MQPQKKSRRVIPTHSLGLRKPDYENRRDRRAKRAHGRRIWRTRVGKVKPWETVEWQPHLEYALNWLQSNPRILAEIQTPQGKKLFKYQLMQRARETGVNGSLQGNFAERVYKLVLIELGLKSKKRIRKKGE